MAHCLLLTDRLPAIVTARSLFQKGSEQNMRQTVWLEFPEEMRPDPGHTGITRQNMPGGQERTMQSANRKHVGGLLSGPLRNGVADRTTPPSIFDEFQSVELEFDPDNIGVVSAFCIFDDPCQVCDMA